MYQKGIELASQQSAQEFYNSTILPLQLATEAYCLEFDSAVKKYMKDNSVLSKMKNSLNPSQSTRSDKIGLSRGKYQNNKKSTQELMSVMLQGHSLLQQIRSALTGMTITTKFIVQVDNKFYEIDEKKIDSNLVLSTFGGGTESNPFSLAYNIDIEMLKEAKLLNEDSEVDKGYIYETIRNLKKPYLDWKKEQWADRGVVKNYDKIFFDSKDAEIYELYAQQTGMEPLELSQYIELRQTLGGGGGYASAFYKSGDVGSVQVKFFNLNKSGKNATVNFARFSLLRDKLRKLNEILKERNLNLLKQGLLDFFTENKKYSSLEQMSNAFNQASKEAINELFKNFT